MTKGSGRQCVRSLFLQIACIMNQSFPAASKQGSAPYPACLSTAEKHHINMFPSRAARKQ